MTLQNSTNHGSGLRKEMPGPKASTVRWISVVCDGKWLQDRHSPDWANLAEEPRAERIKSGHLRTIWRVNHDSKTVIAKIFEIRGGLRRLLDQLGWGEADREFRICEKAYVLGVSVIRPMALGKSTRHVAPNQPMRTSILLSEEITGAETLSAFWRHCIEGSGQHAGGSLANRVIVSVANLYGHAHAQGFYHPDGHPGNILISDAHCEDTIQVCFADLLGARLLGSPLSTTMRARSIAQLDQFFQRCATRSQRWRFLKTYDNIFMESAKRSSSQRLKSGIALASRDGLAQLFRSKSVHGRKLAKHRDQRLRRNGKYFATFSLPDQWRATACLQLERRHVFPEVGIPDRDLGQWREILEPIIRSITDAKMGDGKHRFGDLLVNVESEQSWKRDSGGGESRRQFEQCHRARHRDVEADLILAHSWQTRSGRIVRTITVRPLGAVENRM